MKLKALSLFLLVGIWMVRTGWSSDSTTYVFAIPQIDSSATADTNSFVSLTNDGADNAAVSVSLPGNANKTHFIPFGETVVIDTARHDFTTHRPLLPSELQVKVNYNAQSGSGQRLGRNDSKRITITSNSSLSVVAGSSDGDAFFVLPVSSLGTRYFAVTGQGTCNSALKRKTQITVVNGGQSENLMWVSIVESGYRRNKTEIQVVFSDTQNMWSFVSEADLTGTVIESQHPVAVIAGRQRVEGSNGFEAEMLPPVAAWGTTFPLPFHKELAAPRFVVYRIVAANNNAGYSFEGEQEQKPKMLMAGQYDDLLIDRPLVLKATNSCLVVQMSNYSLGCYNNPQDQRSNQSATPNVTEETAGSDYPVSDETVGVATAASRKTRTTNGFFTLVPPLERYSSQTVMVSDSVYAEKGFESYWVLLSPQTTDLPTCTVGKFEPTIHPLEIDTTGYGRLYNKKDIRGTVLCRYSNGHPFSAISYGISPSGSYAYAHNRWEQRSSDHIRLVTASSDHVPIVTASRPTTAISPTSSTQLEENSTPSVPNVTTEQSTNEVMNATTPGSKVRHQTDTTTASESLPVLTTTDPATTTDQTGNLTAILEHIKEKSVRSPADPGEVLGMLSAALNTSEAMSEDDVRLAVSALENCVNFRGLKKTGFDNYLNTVDKILDQNETVIRNSDTSERLLKSMRTLARNTAASPLSKPTQGRNIAMLVQESPCTRSSGLVKLRNGSVFAVDEWPDPRYKNDAQVFITLPHEKNCDEKRTKRETSGHPSAPEDQDVPGIKTGFIVYSNQKLFPPADVKPPSGNEGKDQGETSCDIKRQPVVNLVVTAYIFSDSHPYTDTHRLNEPISVGFYSEDNQLQLHAQAKCGFWNNGNWSTEGCRLTESKSNDWYVCQCSHLTDFTLLVDVAGKDPSLCDPGISIFTRVLILISIISLVMALSLHFVSKYMKYCFHDTTAIRPNCLRTLVRTPLPRQSKSSLSEPLMGSMLAFLVLFLLLSSQDRLGLSDTGCQIAAAVLYAVLLAQLCWAALAGLSFFKTYYVVFDERTLRALTKRRVGLVASLAIPFTITISFWLASGDFFNRQDRFCWVRPDYVWMAVMIPLSILIMGDAALTVLLIKNFFCVTTALPKAKRKRTLVVQKCIVLLTVQVILAFPWILQYFTLGSPTVMVFHYLFSFTFGSQGAIFACLYVIAYVRWIRRARATPSSSTRLTSTTTSSKWSQRLRKISPWSESSFSST